MDIESQIPSSKPLKRYMQLSIKTFVEMNPDQLARPLITVPSPKTARLSSEVRSRNPVMVMEELKVDGMSDDDPEAAANALNDKGQRGTYKKVSYEKKVQLFEKFIEFKIIHLMTHQASPRA